MNNPFFGTKARLVQVREVGLLQNVQLHGGSRVNTLHSTRESTVDDVSVSLISDFPVCAYLRLQIQKVHLKDLW